MFSSTVLILYLLIHSRSTIVENVLYGIKAANSTGVLGLKCSIPCYRKMHHVRGLNVTVEGRVAIIRSDSDFGRPWFRF
jgi:hypothetical protein